MVNLLNSQSDFLSLLLKTGKQQRRAILDTLSDSQLNLLGEIFYNLINTFPISQSEKNSLSKKRFVKVLTDFKKRPKLRHTVAKKNKKQIEDILLKYKDNLLSLVE